MPESITILAMLAAVGVKALALVVMGVAAAWALRRSSAACRHVLWTAVLASVLIIAVAAPAPPMWPFPWGDSFAISRIVGPGVPEANHLRGHAAQLTPQAERSAEGRTPASTPPRASFGDVLALIWIAGVAVFALRIGAGLLALRRIAARGRAIEGGPARALLPRRVRMIETNAFLVPATWGVLRPVVALPVTAGAWPAPRLEAALRHELAHVRRLDALTQLGADFCCALLWFHPAVWFAARRMRSERERACDNTAITSGGSDVDYAEWLVTLAEEISRGGSGRSVPAAVAMAERHGLEDRLRAILDPATTRSTPRILMASVPACVLVATVTMAGLDVQGSTSPRAAVPAGVESLLVPAPESAELPGEERVPMSIEQERWALARSFRSRDEREAQAIQRLMDATKHEKQHSMDLIRERAVWALWIASEDEVVVPLTESLASPDWRVRAYAAWCLGVAGPADAREALTARLNDPVWRVRAMTATTLAELADPRSTEDMLALLTDPAWQVRLPAVEFLSHVRTAGAREAVRTRLNDPHVAVRSAAVAALGETGIP
jgi:beta-lactamase regulating signal transducer with metallopeptidase domain